MAGLTTQLAVDAAKTDAIATVMPRKILEQGYKPGMGHSLGRNLSSKAQIAGICEYLGSLKTRTSVKSDCRRTSALEMKPSLPVMGALWVVIYRRP